MKKKILFVYFIFAIFIVACSNEQTPEVLATAWAEGLQTRDGQQRYEMMSEKMKEKFKQEQIIRSGKDWNFNIGDSSPWVVDFKVEINGMTAIITYITKTSEPADYNMMETITFGEENGTLVVVDYR